jgi:hypothetical protein
LLPSDKPLTFGGSIPEAGLRLGGTFAINKNNIIYAYEDGVPGDHPKPSEVLKAFDIK